MRSSNAFLKDEYNELVDKGFDWKIRILEGPSAPVCKVDGKDVIMLCSNNYLNLSNHPRLINAAKNILDTYGAWSVRVT
jgi:7-keto-8-aminopelargonate synthetase-like enzyme